VNPPGQWGCTKAVEEVNARTPWEKLRIFITTSISTTAPEHQRRTERPSESGLLRCSDKLARRIFPLFFSITLIFLRSPCSTPSTSTTHWIGLIPTALLRRHRTLSANIELFSKFALWILTTPKPRSVFISSTLAFFHSGILSTLSGKCVLRCYIEFSWHGHVVFHSDDCGIRVTVC